MSSEDKIILDDDLLYNLPDEIGLKEDYWNSIIEKIKKNKKKGKYYG